jgi:hypothetical protein
MASTIYYNFSSDCVNSNYNGVSGPQGNIGLSVNFLNYSFYFSNITGCITNCTDSPAQISGCFKFISSGTTPAYPVYTDFDLNPSMDIYTTTAGCLSAHPCPAQQEITYFKYCCPQQKSPSDDYFGILTDPGVFQLGNVYFIGTSSISACTTVVSSVGLPNNIVVYQNIPYTYQSYSSCRNCTGSTVGCLTTPQPTPTIYYSSDTRCGDNILKRNECDPIVIFPMGVSCFGTNPTLTTISDGSLSLVITGGTPPYSVYWSTGGNGLFLTNLSVGSYSAIVTDYYLDFTAYTTCFLTAPTPIPTETIITRTPDVTPTVTPTPDANYPSFCLTMSVGSPIRTIQQYFTYSGLLINSMPQYIGGAYSIFWNVETLPNGWVINGPTVGGNIQNYNTTIPPLEDWTFPNPQTLNGNVTGVLGECPAYGNLCFTYRQNKGSNSATYEGIVDLFYTGQVNGYPSWQSSDGTYILSWSFAGSTSGRWLIDFTTNPKYTNPVNQNPAVPPLTGWQQPGTVPPSLAIVYNGNCTPSTTVGSADLSGNGTATTGGGGGGTTTGGVSNNTGGLVSGNNLGGAITSSNPSSGNVPFTDAPVDSLGRDGTTTSSANQCECIAVRTISTYPGVAYYTDCSGNPAQINVPGGSGINSRACICRRIGTPVTGGVYEEPCQSVQGSSGGATITNNCLDLIGTSCTSNVTGGGTRSTTTTAQDTGVINNGNITLRASGGYPPYQYSIDGGLTYKTSPLFNKLGPGNYTTIIKDSSGNTFTSQIVLVGPPKPTVYQVSLQTSEIIPRSSSNTTTRQLTSTISVTPELPNGVLISFDLVHTNTFKRSTTLTAATLSTNTLLKKNSINYSANTTAISTGTTLNTTSGCQQRLIYVNNLTETWSSVKYSNLDTLTLNTSTTVTKNSVDRCYVGDAIDDFILTNLTISGCTNCGVSNISI